MDFKEEIEGLKVTYVHPSANGITISWAAPKLGYGELCLSYEDDDDFTIPGKWSVVDDEYMGEEFCRAVIAKLGDYFAENMLFIKR